MKFSNWFILSVLGASIIIGAASCKHDGLSPLDDDDMMIDTIPNTGGGGGTPCDPNVVYFELEILPLLRSRCAFSGCHDAASAQDGVVLTSYERVMATADVRPNNLSGSDLYEVITEDDSDKRMPRPPNAPLSSDQINLIAQWILQGAQNLTCDANAGSCNTSNVTFAADVRPIIQNNCQGCHSGTAPAGGINFTTHGGIAAVAGNGRLFGAISHQAGFVAMPFGGSKLPQCSIDKIKVWIDAGAPNN